MDKDNKVFALLIDADNVSPKYLGAIIEEITTIIIQKDLRRLHRNKKKSLERCLKGQFPNSHPAIREHRRQKFDRLRPYNRCDGYSLYRQCVRFLHSFQRRRFYPSCEQTSRIAEICGSNGRRKNSAFHPYGV